MATTRSSWVPARLRSSTNEVGETVIGSFGSPNTAPLYIPPFKLVIAGTATLPAIGGASNFADHPSMGTGGVLSDNVNPAFIRAAQDPDPNLNGPGLVFVRLRSGVSAAVGPGGHEPHRHALRQGLHRRPERYGRHRRGPWCPTPSRNRQLPIHRSNTRDPRCGPCRSAQSSALALTLIASVRRRRRDLALLKTLGFTTRQLAATIAWQASVIAVDRNDHRIPRRHRRWAPTMDPLRSQASTLSPNPRYPSP